MYSTTRFIIHVFPVLLGLCIAFVGAACMFGRLSPTPPQIYFSAYEGRYSGFATLDINRRLLAPLFAKPIDVFFSPYDGWDVNNQQIVMSTLIEYDKNLLMLIDLQQRSYRWITQEGNSFNPVYSPDGKYIAFQSYDSGKSEIYIMDADGNNKRQLSNTQNALPSTEPIWSPDSRHILFEMFLPLNQTIYSIDIDGMQQRQLTSDNEWNGQPDWSPDGRFIAFASTRDGNHEIYTMNADGTNQQRLTNNIKNDERPVWSPNGEQIVFSSRRDSLTIKQEIYVMQADGSDQRLLVGTRGGDNFPRWWPDGTQILFYGGRDQFSKDGGNGLTYLVNIDGSNLQQLTSDMMQLNANEPIWRVP